MPAVSPAPRRIGAAGPVEAAAPLRPIPYPYRAMLAICSDLDETPDRDVYWESMRFLNSTAVTRMGPGVGLEVGNSIYFDMPPGQFAYWNTDDHGRAMVRTLIRSGHIDCLHSFGDLAGTRGHAARALAELARHDCPLEVWIDHAVAPSNFGADIMQGRGDVPGDEAYHADLSHGMGIQFVWRGRVTSVIGQDVRRSLRGILRRRHLAQSARTLLKEWLKGVLARRGSGKYALHGSNDLLRPVELRSGHRVWEFFRTNPHWAGVSRGETADGLADVLTERTLDRLVERGGASLLYTHLGKVTRQDQPLGPRTRAALRLLARYHREGRVLVTTSRRLLGYARAVRLVGVTTRRERDADAVDIRVSAGACRISRRDVEGLTVYVAEPARARVSVNGRVIADARRNAPDQTGRGSVSIPWSAREFPVL